MTNAIQAGGIGRINNALLPVPSAYGGPRWIPAEELPTALVTELTPGIFITNVLGRRKPPTITSSGPSGLSVDTDSDERVNTQTRS